MKQFQLLHILILCSLQSVRAQRTLQTRPNIIFIFADDLGWNDVGFHGSNQIPTPNIDALAYSGTILHNYYTQPLCTPSRSALMTGRHPINNGMQTKVIFAPEPWGLPLSEKLLPEYLQELGYVTRAVGKWHLGFFEKRYTPTSRGFDSHFGYWLGHKHYFSHFSGVGNLRGYDFRRNMDSSWDSAGKYTTDLVTSEAEDIIKHHNTIKPLFLYLAHLATHAPLEAPKDVIDRFPNITYYKRRVYAAMTSKLDESVGRVISALKAKGLLDNSIIIFASDNGGATNHFDGNVGSNWPLRGSKDTLFEGGVRVPAIIWSPLLTTAPSIHLGLMSVMDWLPTLLSAVNGTFIPTANRDIDGYNQWDTLLGKVQAPYKTLLHNIDEIRNLAAIRDGSWKLIKGSTHAGRFNNWYGAFPSEEPYDLFAVTSSLVTRSIRDTSKPLPGTDTILMTRKANIISCLSSDELTKCRPKKRACLFNIDEDPCEQNNLAQQHPRILAKLLNMIREKYHPKPANNRRMDPRSMPSYWNNTWCNWHDYTSPQWLY